MTRACVVGAGPTGRALAVRLRTHGAAVALVDPHIHRRWQATYAAWTDELPRWTPPAAVGARHTHVVAHTRRRVRIDRGYTVLDTAGLQDSLDLAGIEVHPVRAADLTPRSVRLADGTAIESDVVIDCRGAASVGGHSPRQTAYGITVPDAVAAPILAGADVVLMDWRHPRPDARWHEGGAPASFLYAVGMGDGTTLLEETCLVGRPALALNDLRDRLYLRLAGHGVTPDAARDVERVSFPMTAPTATPWSASPPAFGAAGGLLNPTTGYGVATAMRAADTVATAIAEGTDAATALWPRRARAVHRLRTAGLEVLLALDPAQTAAFFDAFLALPVSAQRAYLSARGDLSGTLWAMALVFARIDTRTRLRVLQTMG